MSEELKPCGGCGETDPMKRCIGCLHDFGERARTAPTGEKVEAVPVAWQRRLSGEKVIGGVSSWRVVSEDVRAHDAERGHPHGFPDLKSELRPLYSAETVAALEAERDEARRERDTSAIWAAKANERAELEGRRVEAAESALVAANARVERLEKALAFYADPEHWRTRNADGDRTRNTDGNPANRGYGLGYHRTDPDGIMEVLGSNCGRWAASTFEVHGGHWQADAGHVARAALAALEPPHE